MEEIPPRIAQLLARREAAAATAAAAARRNPSQKPRNRSPNRSWRLSPSPSRSLCEPEPEPEPVVDRQEQAREEAQAALMPFAEDLADLVDKESAGRRRSPVDRLGR